jgi:hypothetical protein
MLCIASGCETKSRGVPISDRRGRHLEERDVSASWDARGDCASTFCEGCCAPTRQLRGASPRIPPVRTATSSNPVGCFRCVQAHYARYHATSRQSHQTRLAAPIHFSSYQSTCTHDHQPERYSRKALQRRRRWRRDRPRGRSTRPGCRDTSPSRGQRIATQVLRPPRQFVVATASAKG